MAFLDNSGDIILDAVLTDTGRMRLARGDGSFRIAKFALGDDEINYESYNKNHTSGSAFYDLTILQTPVLEAFTNNTSTMKSKLLTVARQDLLYLPVIRLNHDAQAGAGSTRNLTTRADADGGGAYVLTVDQASSGDLPLDGNIGVLHGDANGATNTNPIMFDQGLDTTERQISEANALSAGNPLRETQYIVEVDDRFLKLATPENAALASVSFIDDDQIASYFFSEVSDPAYIENIAVISVDNAPANNKSSSIRGPAGTRLMFKLRASEQATNSTFLFTKFGSTGYQVASGGNSYRFIDTTVRVTGFTTGFRVDIPVRLVKKI